MEKELKIKAFDIIYDKDVNPIDIRYCSTVEQYNIKENDNIPLTGEEFLILKTTLGEENHRSFKWRYENIASRLYYLEKNYSAEIKRGKDMDGIPLTDVNKQILLNLHSLTVSLIATLESDKDWWN